LAALPEGEAIMKSFVVDMAPEAYQKGVLEGMERGVEKGRMEGMEKGMERGMEEGVDYARRLLLRLMYSRFDSVPDGLKEKLDAVRGLSVLESLSDTVLDGASLEDIERGVDKALGRK
jgi:flagellar biosynthesis/type III secretory pathway protein FliH